MNVIYLLGLIKQGMHFFEFANSNHIAFIYIVHAYNGHFSNRLQIFQNSQQPFTEETACSEVVKVKCSLLVTSVTAHLIAVKQSVSHLIPV